MDPVPARSKPYGGYQQHKIGQSRGHYQPPHFFREAPRHQLARYFKERRWLLEFDFEGLSPLKRGAADPLYSAWEGLPPAVQAHTNKDFRAIDLLAQAVSPGDLITLAAKRYQGDLEALFAPMRGTLEKAFHLFLEYPGVFSDAVRLSEVSDPQRGFRRQRRNDLPALRIAELEIGKPALEGAVRAVFKQEGRGYDCWVDDVELEDRQIFFVYPADYAKSILNWDSDGNLKPLSMRPAFQLVFHFQPGCGALEIFFTSEVKANVVQALSVAFARTMLDAEIPLRQRNKPVFRLNALLDPDYSFALDRFPTVRGIRLVKLRFSLFGHTGTKFTVEVDPDQGAGEAIRLARHLVTALFPDRLGLADVNVYQASLRAYFLPDGFRGKPTRTFDIGHPNSCSLGFEGRDHLLRTLLTASGIETSVAQDHSHIP